MKVLYRISDAGYIKEKPNYVNPKSVFSHFINVFVNCDIYVIADNVSDETYDFICNNISKERVTRTTLSNAGAFMYAVDYAIQNFKDSDIVYFAEDDYIYRKNAPSIIEEGLTIADYSSGYDHPDKYIDKKKGGPNPYISEGGELTRVLITSNSHWKYTNSTCMTFAVKVKTIKEDLDIYRKHCSTNHPYDFEMFDELIKTRNRKLATSIPGVSTHGETMWLSKFVDWEMEFNLNTENKLIGKTYRWNNGYITFKIDRLETPWGNGNYTIIAPFIVSTTWNNFNHILIFSKDYNKYTSTRTYPADLDYTTGNLDTSPLSQKHGTLTLKHGIFRDEIPEQIMSLKFLTGNEKVLELGANIGRNSLIIASILKDSRNLVTLECNINIARELSENRDINKFNFHVEPSAMSKRQLIQRSWDTIVSDVVLDGYTKVNTITFDELVRKYNIEFDTLVADCEGALYYILMDMPEMLEKINFIMMENDYHDLEHKKFVDSVLMKAGFECVYKEAGGWGPCHDFFYEAWRKSA